MAQIASIKGHFDGCSVVLDEPASLAIGQAVRVVVESTSLGETARPSAVGFAEGMLPPAFTPYADMTAKLMNGNVWDESAAPHIDPLDAVPADFARCPGSAAGQIQMTDDFAATPEEFEEYR